MTTEINQAIQKLGALASKREMEFKHKSLLTRINTFLGGKSDVVEAAKYLGYIQGINDAVNILYEDNK